MWRASFVVLVACSGPPPGGDGPGDDDDDDDDTIVVATGSTGSTAETGGPTDSGTVTAGPPGVRGVVVDAAGVAINNCNVLACTSVTCFTDESAADGTFAFDLDAPVHVAVKTHEDLTTTPRRGAALEPIYTDHTVDVGTLWVPDLPAGVRIGDPEDDPQTLALGDGLELTLNRADLVPDFGVFLYDVAARRLPAEHVPVYEELAGEEVVAVFAIHPFATTSSSPIAVRFPTDLPAGTVVNLRHIDHIDGRMSAPVTGRSDGSFVTTDPGQGVLHLTHLVVSKP